MTSNQLMLLDIRTELIAEGYEVLIIHKSYIKTPKRLADNKAHTDKELAERWFSWIQTNTDFDQLIMETSNGRDYWIHVSCRKNAKKNRHQVLRLTKK